MADYYPLLARALDALPDRSPALRKAVYDRARSALIAQLRSLDPPVAEADIDLERQSLDAAIERLEVDFGAPPAKPEPGRSKPIEPRPVELKPAKPDVKPDTRPAAKPSQPETPSPKPQAGSAPPPPPPKPSDEARGTASSKPAAAPPPVEPKPEPEPAPPLPEPSAANALPEAGPPADFVPFVPPPRKPKADAAPPPPATDDEAAPAVPPPETAGASRRPRIDVVAPRTGRSRLLRNAVVGGILAVVIGVIAVAAFMLRDKPAELPQGAETEGSQSDQADSKFADRVGGGSEPERRPPPTGAAPQPEVTVAQHAVLYDENVADPRATPKATQGRVVWRLEPVNGEQGQPLQSAVRATIDYPDAGFSLVMTIRKNLDATLPASHTIELAFTGKGDERTVQEVGLPQFKDEQNGRGATVSGLPVRVRDNLFLVGLSNVPSDVERNTDMLTRKNWIDIGVRFKAGPRGVLSFDKGTAGTQAVQSAFDQWKR